MGVAVDIRGGEYSTSLSIIPPVTRGLEYCNVFGDPGVNPGRNLAPGKPWGKVIGAPFPNGQSANLDDQNHIRLPFSDTDAFTHIGVAGQNALADGSYGYVVGSYVSQSAPGSNLLMNFGGAHPLLGFVGRVANGAVSVDQIGNMPSTAFGFAAVRGSSTQATRFDNKTAGTFVVDPTNPVKPRSVSPALFRIGASPAGVGGNVNVCLVMIYSVVLTDAELEAIYLWAKHLLADISALVI